MENACVRRCKCVCVPVVRSVQQEEYFGRPSTYTRRYYIISYSLVGVWCLVPYTSPQPARHNTYLMMRYISYLLYECYCCLYISTYGMIRCVSILNYIAPLSSLISDFAGRTCVRTYNTYHTYDVSRRDLQISTLGAWGHSSTAIYGNHQAVSC